MTQTMINAIFNSVWGILVLAAIVAQLLFAEKPKTQAGFFINTVVYLPFLLVFGMFFLRHWIGIYVFVSLLPFIGAGVMTLGLAGYLASLLFLGKNWSLSASIRQGHKLVSNGPYKFVRHPMYSCMILIFFGSGLLISNYLVFIFTPVVGFTYYLRARTEEKLLGEEFPEYRAYMKQTRMLIPGII